MTRNDIIEHVYGSGKIRSYCQRFPNWEDLLHEFIEKLSTFSGLILQYQTDYFDLWCLSVINNIARTERRNDKLVLSEIPDFSELPYEPDERLDCVVAAFEHLDWYDRELYKAWLKMKSARKLSSATRIERRSILASIKKIHTQIQCKCQ